MGRSGGDTAASIAADRLTDHQFPFHPNVFRIGAGMHDDAVSGIPEPGQVLEGKHHINPGIEPAVGQLPVCRRWFAGRPCSPCCSSVILLLMDDRMTGFALRHFHVVAGAEPCHGQLPVGYALFFPSVFGLCLILPLTGRWLHARLCFSRGSFSSAEVNRSVGGKTTPAFRNLQIQSGLQARYIPAAYARGYI